MRATSARPELVVDTTARKLGDPPIPNTKVGLAGPFGRGRMLAALALAPQWLRRHQVLDDGRGFYLGDPGGNLVGRGGVYVSRMLAASKVEDTRKL